MPRFVVLEHDHPNLHWDLMLEGSDALRTWRLALAPAGNSIRIAAVALGAHRKVYLDYEGPVSGQRGSVQRWDLGGYNIGSETDDLLVIAFSGQRLHGVWRLVHQAGTEWWFECDNGPKEEP